MNFFKSLYIHNRFFLYISGISLIFLVGKWVPFLAKLSWIVVWAFVFFSILDIFLLFRLKNGFSASRTVNDKLSNSDENNIVIQLENNYGMSLDIKVIDEIPIQFQKRDFNYKSTIAQHSKKSFEYQLRPTERGGYEFGNILVFASSFLRIFSRKYLFDAQRSVCVYPSYIQMQKYSFLAMSNRLHEFGLKKIRRIGHTMEFEKIKEYTDGDDARTINWKATAKRAQIMVNQYQDERAQPIYSLIDMGRSMKMPFDGLKLIDYAINSTLAFSNVGIIKGDKTGLITFSNTIETIIPASQKKTHLNTINEALYNLDTDFSESNFGVLYNMIRKKITQRSLLILYTNFEHQTSLKRQMPFITALAKKHLLLVVFFKNSELNEKINSKAETVSDIYEKTIAEKFDYEKRLIVKELEKSGIKTLLTNPSELSVNVINKYHQFKAKGLI
ncbi:DUF58 domain-containing protein [Aureivirga sp. CE67]|uniref:DUF58 domain-containing protein n=1 Tax=Aureivirga sp. CE67 TaxID=1788983 RepID=UPI0018C995F4|nr:DUF58 domain-containing protein [Aureivirga sp. CE67]